MLFFFQAEDGIRDHCVTGVQTCALPISLTAWANGVPCVPGTSTDCSATSRRLYGPPPAACVVCALARLEAATFIRVRSARSEERRVGKEWWYLWSRGGCTVNMTVVLIRT